MPASNPKETKKGKDSLRVPTGAETKKGAQAKGGGGEKQGGKQTTAKGHGRRSRERES
jgi:hypothetical protein